MCALSKGGAVVNKQQASLNRKLVVGDNTRLVNCMHYG